MTKEGAYIKIQNHSRLLLFTKRLTLQYTLAGTEI